MKKIIFLDFDGVLNTEYNRWKEKYSLVTNILHITPFRQKRQNRCGMLSHVEVSIHSMMRVAHGRSDSVVSVLLSKISMRNWRIGWGWRLRTTIGMRNWIENGRKTCNLYSPFIIYTIIATSHYTTSYGTLLLLFIKIVIFHC